MLKMTKFSFKINKIRGRLKKSMKLSPRINEKSRTFPKTDEIQRKNERKIEDFSRNR